MMKKLLSLSSLLLLSFCLSACGSTYEKPPAPPSDIPPPTNLLQ